MSKEPEFLILIRSNRNNFSDNPSSRFFSNPRLYRSSRHARMRAVCQNVSWLVHVHAGETQRKAHVGERWRCLFDAALLNSSSILFLFFSLQRHIYLFFASPKHCISRKISVITKLYTLLCCTVSRHRDTRQKRSTEDGVAKYFHHASRRGTGVLFGEPREGLRNSSQATLSDSERGWRSGQC